MIDNYDTALWRRFPGEKRRRRCPQGLPSTRVSRALQCGTMALKTQFPHVEVRRPGGASCQARRAARCRRVGRHEFRIPAYGPTSTRVVRSRSRPRVLSSVFGGDIGRKGDPQVMRTLLRGNTREVSTLTRGRLIIFDTLLVHTLVVLVV